MKSFNPGDTVLWISDKGYSARAGQRAEVYAVNHATRRAAINTIAEGELVSYSVSFDELSHGSDAAPDRVKSMTTESAEYLAYCKEFEAMTAAEWERKLALVRPEDCTDTYLAALLYVNDPNGDFYGLDRASLLTLFSSEIAGVERHWESIRSPSNEG